MLQRILFMFFLSLFFSQAVGCEKGEVIKIGVLSHRGDEITKRAWKPTAEYLTRQLSGYCFEIQPLKFDEINDAVGKGKVDFILVNPGIYVNLEVRYRVSRLATMNNRRGNEPYNIFGGVIFTSSKHPEMNSLEDIVGKSFMAVDKTSLGGFQMAWREFNAQGISPYSDFKSVQFGETHDHVVMSVIKGEVDAGTVRTDILERMITAGIIKKGDFRILNQRQDKKFPFIHSTRLYPEWPFSRLQHTSTRLAQDVAIALLQMPKNHPAAKSGNYSGWTVPLDYQPVHDLFKELGLSPYEEKFTLWEAAKLYWYWAVISLLALVVMVFITIFVTQRNRYLRGEKATLERQNKLILDSVADGIYGVDVQGNSTFINHAMEKITGWTSSDLIGKNQHKILHHTYSDGSHHPRDKCPVYLTFKDNKPRFVTDDVFWKKDGTSFPVEYSATPIRDEKGKTLGSVVVFRDITERNRVEQKRQEHQNQINHVARLSTLGEIASSIAHELNQPLTAISTNARACVRMLESGKPQTERCADVVEKIAMQSERAGEVIRHIRHFAHKETSNKQVVEISKIINTVLELLKVEIQKNNINVMTHIDSRVKCVFAQDIQIEQVILNLVRNAIDAMKNTQDVASIKIAVTPKGKDLAEIRISDTGPGLSSDISEQIFSPFVTTKPEGMGLGLSISYSIIESHDSMLHVDSSEGEGASFYFTLATKNKL